MSINNSDKNFKNNEKCEKKHQNLKGDFSMDKKTFVIVGAGKGLGNAVAKEFANHDFRVVLIARNINHLEEYKEEFENEGIETYIKVGDATKPETLIKALDEVKEEIGTPDVYVYHVGITASDPDEITNDLLMERYQVDVASAYVTTNHLAKDPKFGEKNGTVIFTGGGFAKSFSTIPFLKPLCIDKAAMNAACIVLHDTLKDKSIFVGSILVSGVIDPQDEKYAPNLIAKEYWKMYETKSEYQVQY